MNKYEGVIYMNKRGFTLTEMMIVILIISSLMLLIVPNLMRTKATVETKTCEAYIKLVDSQIQAYLLDHPEVKRTELTIDMLVSEKYIEQASCPNSHIVLEIDPEDLSTKIVDAD